jgi:hypothetical protein
MVMFRVGPYLREHLVSVVMQCLRGVVCKLCAAGQSEKAEVSMKTNLSHEDSSKVALKMNQ